MATITAAKSRAFLKETALGAQEITIAKNEAGDCAQHTNAASWPMMRSQNDLERR